jgi:hypothetical protein
MPTRRVVFGPEKATEGIEDPTEGAPLRANPDRESDHGLTPGVRNISAALGVALR